MATEDDDQHSQPLSDHARIGWLEDQVRLLWKAQSLVSDQVAEYEAKRDAMEKEQDQAIANGLEKAIVSLIERQRRNAADNLLSWLWGVVWGWATKAVGIAIAAIIVIKFFGPAPVLLALENWLKSGGKQP